MDFLLLLFILLVINQKWIVFYGLEILVASPFPPLSFIRVLTFLQHAHWQYGALYIGD